MEESGICHALVQEITLGDQGVLFQVNIFMLFLAMFIYILSFRSYPSKHFNVVSTLSFGWYDVVTCKTSNPHWNNVAYSNFGIYNVEQRLINVVHFNVDVSNVRQRRNNVALFNVEFHNVGQQGSNVVKMTISKRNKKIPNYIHWIKSFYCYFIIFFFLLTILQRICWIIVANLHNLDHEKHCIARALFKLLHFVTYRLVFNIKRGLVQTTLWLTKF